MIITLKEALEIMQTSDRFNIKFVTADKSRNTGGEIKEVENGFLQKRTEKGDMAKAREGTKIQNHYKNLTRNVHRDEGHPVKLHVFLITEINGKEVTLY